MTAEEIGHLGEDRAQKYLLRNNYKIADTNFTTSVGEIDIVATKISASYSFELPDNSASFFVFPNTF